FGLIGGVETLVRQLDAGQLTIPMPAASVQGWPLIGERVYRLWALAATNTKELLVEVAPSLKPLGDKLVAIAGSVGLSLLEFLVSILIAGFLFSPGPRLIDALAVLLRRVLSDRGEKMVQLAGATIRNVSRGVVGIALLQ